MFRGALLSRRFFSTVSIPCSARWLQAPSRATRATLGDLDVELISKLEWSGRSRLAHVCKPSTKILGCLLKPLGFRGMRARGIDVALIYMHLELPLTTFCWSFWFLGVSGRFDFSGHCCGFLRAFWPVFAGVLLQQDTCRKLRPFAAKTATKPKQQEKSSRWKFQASPPGRG